MTWTPFEFRGKTVSCWKVPESRFTVLRFFDSITQITDELLKRPLNVLVPSENAVWWMDRILPDFDPDISAERYLLELIADPELPVPRAPMAALGGEAAIRLGFRYPSLFPVVAGWDFAFDFHDDYGSGTSLDRLFERREQARQYTACLQVRPNDYPPHIWFGCPADSVRYRGHDRLHEKLNAVGVPHEFVVAETYPPVTTILDFVSNNLEKRSRRLL